MDGQEMMKELRAQASEKYRGKYDSDGDTGRKQYWCGNVRSKGLAKKAGKSQELAFELWNTKYHEARMLAVLLMNPKATTDAEAERLLLDVVSRDLCDHLCKNLFLKMKSRDNFIAKWIREPQLYKKRAAFVLIAASVIHDRKLTDETVDGYLELVTQYADDGREHVKKAVSTALREIGKRTFIIMKRRFCWRMKWMEGESKALRWIGKDAAKELETMVKAEGRGRLISANTRMGKESGGSG